jgi:hypothetical protein
MTAAEFTAWLQSRNRRLVVLLEADALVEGVLTTFYFSSKPFASAPGATPASQPYRAVLKVAGRTTGQLALTSGAGGFTVGDAELDNTDGALTFLLGYVWTKKAHRVYVGDATWARADFRLVFDGLSSGLFSRTRKVLNLKCKDKLEQLNTSISEVKLGGATINADRMIPVTLGEVFNITPLLADKATLKEQVHTGAIEAIIETRDNGVVVATTNTLAAGTYVHNVSPVNGGVITNSVQGDKVAGVYNNTISTLVQRLATGFGNDPFDAGDLDASNLAAFDAANPQPVGLYVPDPDFTTVIAACQQFAGSVGAQAVISALSQLQLLQVAVPAPGAATIVTAANMDERSLEVSDRPAVVAAVKIAYCRNYTPQTNLQTGIPPEHKAIFAQEWRTVTASDGDIAADHGLTTEPQQEETLLLKRTDALAEASRRLALRGPQRTIFRYVGRPELMLQELGGPQILAHPGFGLSGESTSSLTIGIGAKSLTIGAGGQLCVGQTVRVFRTSDTDAWMQGTVTGYDAGTGALDVDVDEVNGAGTFEDWTAALCGQIIRVERDWMRPRVTFEVYA